MKTIKNIFLVAVVSSMIMTMSCDGGGDDGPSDSDRFVGTWGGADVTLDGFNVTSPEYANFTLTFNGDGSYITVDGDPVFTDTGGFWEITSGAEGSFIITMDGTTVNTAFNADFTTLSLSFIANDEVIGARSEGLVGDYEFSLTKQ